MPRFYIDLPPCSDVGQSAIKSAIALATIVVELHSSPLIDYTYAAVPARVGLLPLSVAMIAQLTALADFITSSRSALGGGGHVDKVRQEQVDRFNTTLQSTPLELDIASGLVQALQTDKIRSAFTDDQRRVLAESAMNSVSITSETNNSKRYQSQVHYHMEKYLTDADWNVLMTSSDGMSKVHTLVRRAHCIGLVYPTELTVASVVAIIKAGNDRLTSDDMHSLVLEYKKLNKVKRPGVHRTMDAFPQCTKQFIDQFPAAYKDEVPSARVPYDEIALDRARSNMAARKSHRSLAAKSSGSQLNQQPENMLHAFTSALMSHFKCTMDGSRPDIKIFPQPRKQLALADGSPGDDSQGSASSSVSVHPALPLPLPAPQLALPSPSPPPSPASKLPLPLSPTPAATPPTKPTLDATLAAITAAMDDKADTAKKARAGAAKRPAAAAAPGPVVTMKRPAAAPAAALPAAGAKPSVCVVACRSCVTARTGLQGAGMTKSIHFVGDSAAARAEAIEWLRARCDELGAECPY